MVTNAELINTFLERQGLKRLTKNEQDFSPLMPFIIMDAVYQIYCTDIQGLKCKHLAAKYQRAWSTDYSLYNRDFFSNFNEEQQGAIIDKMDRFEEFISHHILVAKVSIMNYVSPQEDLKGQNTIAACIVANALAQMSVIIWGHIYKTASGAEKPNPFLSSIVHDTYKFMNAWHDENGGRGVNINCNKSPQVSTAIDVLCNKMSEFLKKDSDSQKAALKTA